MELACPSCRKALTVSNHVAGDEIRCPACRHAFVVTTTDPANLRSDGTAPTPAGQPVPRNDESSWEFLHTALAAIAKATAPLRELGLVIGRFYWDNRKLFVDFFSDRTWSHGDGVLLRVRPHDDTAVETTPEGWTINLPNCCAACGRSENVEAVEEERFAPDAGHTLLVMGLTIGAGLLLGYWQGWWVLPVFVVIAFVLGHVLRSEQQVLLQYHVCEPHRGHPQFPALRILNGDPLVIGVRVGSKSVKDRFKGGTGDREPGSDDETRPHRRRPARPQETNDGRETMPLSGDDGDDWFSSVGVENGAKEDDRPFVDPYGDFDADSDREDLPDSIPLAADDDDLEDNLDLDDDLDAEPPGGGGGGGGSGGKEGGGPRSGGGRKTTRESSGGLAAPILPATYRLTISDGEEQSTSDPPTSARMATDRQRPRPPDAGTRRANDRGEPTIPLTESSETYAIPPPATGDTTAGRRTVTPEAGTPDGWATLDRLPQGNQFNHEFVNLYETLRWTPYAECGVCGIVLPIDFDPKGTMAVVGKGHVLREYLQRLELCIGDVGREMLSDESSYKNRVMGLCAFLLFIMPRASSVCSTPLCGRCRKNEEVAAVANEVRAATEQEPARALVHAIPLLERGRRREVARAVRTAREAAESLAHADPNDVATRTLGALVQLFRTEAEKHARQRVPKRVRRELQMAVAARLPIEPHPLVAHGAARAVERVRPERHAYLRQRRPAGVLCGILLSVLIPACGMLIAQENLVDRAAAELPVESRPVVAEVRVRTNPVAARFESFIRESREWLGRQRRPFSEIPERTGDVYPVLLLGLLLLPVLVVSISLLRRIGLLLGGRGSDGSKAAWWGRLARLVLGLAVLTTVLAAISLAGEVLRGLV